MNNNNYYKLPKNKVHSFDRFLAKGLDLLIMVLVALVLQLVWYPFAALFAIIYAFTHDSINNGISPGKQIVGLKVVSNDNKNITWKNSLIRNLSFGLFTIFAFLVIYHY